MSVSFSRVSSQPATEEIPGPVAAAGRKPVPAAPIPVRQDADDQGLLFRVSKTMINFWLDAALSAVFVGLSIVAVIVQFVFPPGVGAKGWMLWGMNYGQWCSIQFALLSALGFGIVVHVMLHWTWVCGVVAKRLMKQRELPDDGIRTVYGVGVLIGLLLFGGVLVGVAMMTIQMPPV